ncbi:hypothetical protein ACA081_00165 [Candidatus Hodgkinia cicadicola]
MDLESGSELNPSPAFQKGDIRENGVVKWIRYPAYPDKVYKKINKRKTYSIAPRRRRSEDNSRNLFYLLLKIL